MGTFFIPNPSKSGSEHQECVVRSNTKKEPLYDEGGITGSRAKALSLALKIFHLESLRWCDRNVDDRTRVRLNPELIISEVDQ